MHTQDKANMTRCQLFIFCSRIFHSDVHIHQNHIFYIYMSELYIHIHLNMCVSIYIHIYIVVIVLQILGSVWSLSKVKSHTSLFLYLEGAALKSEDSEE